MINIAELLKDVPKGMKLYSPLFGEVNFVGIDKQSDYPINVTDCKGNGKSFTEFGVYFADHPDAECLLFPSKDSRTLEGWKLPVEPKFKVRDWLVYKNGNCFAGSLTEVQVVKVKDGVYFFASGTSGSCKFIDENCRLWAIEDAKDGDVLATDNGWTCIFKAFDERAFSSYCFMDSSNWFCEFGSEVHTPDSRINGNIHPATKEQRDQFFAKIKEAGYEWDAEKKELRKIRPHYDISNFHVGMPVLVRDGDNKKWLYTIFGMYNKDNKIYPFVVVDMRGYVQCIPFEENEHLLGTTDIPDECYINW